ncbi:MAG: hypothetical protein M3441_12870 [Chloroflexota bacterium]|nr:hypothetical protein [Chloroflexota bacterium]
MDTRQPYTFYVYEANQGTFAYNWRTNQRTLLSTRWFNVCGPRGLLYHQTPEGIVWRFSSEDPQGRVIERIPTHVAHDGSLQVYSYKLENGQRVLRSSADGGLTWEQRMPPGGFNFASNLVVSEADAQVLHVAVLAVAAPAQPGQSGQPTGLLSTSFDGGRTWRAGSRLQHDPGIYRLEPMPGATAPDNLLLHVGEMEGTGAPGFFGTATTLLQDNGQTVDEIFLGRNTSKAHIRFVYAPQGIFRLFSEPGDQRASFDLSIDNGRTWGKVSGAPSGEFAAAKGVPGMLFLYAVETLHYSLTGGRTWQSVPDYTDRSVWSYFFTSHTPYRLDVAPYFPSAVLGVKEGRLQVLDLPADGTGLLEAALPQDKGVSNTTFFPQTSHNMRGAFAQYWNSRGGLPQQGYPLTEPFQQVSDVDGKVYLTQYFERAVFELHPENQPPHDVLLSLLGVEAYRQKYGSAGAPGQRVSTDNPRYFPETGHTIGGKFRRYWEEHGGLAQQGYPVSEEFTETSALDGKTYTVQYFERAVMELHPENQPPHDVLLSQLGTLKARQLSLSDPAPTP